MDIKKFIEAGAKLSEDMVGREDEERVAAVKQLIQTSQLNREDLTEAVRQVMRNEAAYWEDFYGRSFSAVYREGVYPGLFALDLLLEVLYPEFRSEMSRLWEQERPDEIPPRVRLEGAERRYLESRVEGAQLHAPRLESRIIIVTDLLAAVCNAHNIRCSMHYLYIFSRGKVTWADFQRKLPELANFLSAAVELL